MGSGWFSIRNKLNGLDRKHKPSKSMKVKEDLKAPSEGIPSSKRIETAADT